MKEREQIPPTLNQVLVEAPLAWGCIALYEYKARRKTAWQIAKEWREYKNEKYKTNGKHRIIKGCNS
jgi:hypothetical protein